MSRTSVPVTRGVHTCAILMVLVSSFLVSGVDIGMAETTPIQEENAAAGSSDWVIGTQAPPAAIEGYASEISVVPGELLSLHVSVSPQAMYRVEIYRLGWYAGDGARRLACIPNCDGEEQGFPQATPTQDPVTGIVDAQWPVTDTQSIARGWVSGYYLAKLVLTTGSNSGRFRFVPFIVREAAGAHSAILVQAAVNTWEAYNDWGGKSLYAYNSDDGKPAIKVSFNRPFALEGNTSPLTWEYQLVRFLEQRGYDVSYTTDVDVDRNPAQLRHHRLVITAGHDEYWSKSMRDGFEAALAAGTNLVFLGGNTAHSQIRYEDGSRVLVEYRSPAIDPYPDPAQRTGTFDQLGRPECELLGVEERNGLGHAGDASRDYKVVGGALSDPWFANTGFVAGSVVADAVGYEWDRVIPDCNVPGPVRILFHYEGAPSSADAVTYSAPSGARVFSSGSIQFSWSLDDFAGHALPADPRLQQFAQNLVDDLSSKARPLLPTNSIAPSIEGHPRVARILSADIGRWISSSAMSYTYQWLRCDDRGVVDREKPVAYWRVGEISGSTAADSSGGGYAASYEGGIVLGTPGIRSDDPDTSVDLDGNSGLIALPPIPIPGRFSFELWMKPRPVSSDTSAYETLFAEDDSYTRHVLWHPSDGRLLAQFDGNFFSTVPLEPGTWHQVVYTFNGSAERFYVDGNRAGRDFTTLPTLSGNLSLGATRKSSSYYFNGQMDEISVYSSALSAAEVQAHYSGCRDIKGASHRFYVPKPVDIGQRIRVSVRGTNADGSVSVRSVPTKAIKPS